MALRILVVDDHERARRAIMSILAKRADWQVCGEASNGMEAIARANELRPDAVLMDVSMPKMDGLQAAQAVRQQLPDTKVIIVSQNDPAVVREQATQAGAQAFVEKGAIAIDLIPSIEKLFAEAKADSDIDLPAKHHGEEVSGWLPAGGEMGERIRGTNWAQTPLGETTSWSPALRMIVKFLLANRFPQLLWWGSEFCSIYNDAYIPILGTKHPWALGRPVSEVWNEIWHVLKPLIETPYSGGPATWMEDIALEINRRGFLEETHFTIAYSPVPDETVPGGIGGVLATVHEITEKVVGERRVRALRDLGARSVEPRSVEEACSIVREALSTHAKDLPFLLLYLVDETRQNARLGCTIGAERGDRACPESVELGSRTDEVWPLSRVLATEDIQLVQDLGKNFDRVPQGPWSDAPASAAVLPIRSNIPHQLAGFMVAGLSSRIQFDKSYRDFLELMSTQIATTIANARAYEEERKRSEALAEIDRAKTVFFSNVSHEFRTPLTLMLGPLEDVLADDKGLDDGQRKSLEVAHRNSLRLLKLVNTLLDFSRFEAGRIQACYESTDLARLTTDLASLFRSAIERAGLKLLVNCPVTAEPAYVDREMWEKIVFNLLSNAFKFTFQGEIEVSMTALGDRFELAVRDTGTGIPEEDIEHLFERFYRVEGARGRTWEGSGIGLALVQELAKLHGGSVRVESKPNRGSRFVVTIPSGKDHLPADRIGAKPTLASTGVRSEAYVQEALHWSGTGQQDISEGAEFASLIAADPAPPSAHITPENASRVLLADDNADMRDYISALLSENYEVHACADGQSALELARQLRPDLVLADVMMPRLDGFGLLRAIREDEHLKRTPVILISARAGQESRIEGLDAGADDYLAKPFSAQELMARVGSHLTLARVRHEAADRERRLRSEAELERARLRAIIETTPQCVKLVAPDGTLLEMNSQGLEMIGVSSADMVVGQSVYSLIAPEDRAKYKDFNERICGGEKSSLQFDIIGLQGKRRRMESHAVPLRNPDGTVVQLAVSSDISERKQAERALSEQARLLDLSNDAIFTRDSADRVTYWNRAATELYGFTREEALGRVTHEFLQTEFPVPLNEIREQLHRDERWGGELVHTTKDGAKVIVMSRWVLVREASGSSWSVLETNNDITLQKQIEKAVRESEGRFRALVNATSYVVYRMSPDWSEMRQLEGRGLISDTGEPRTDWLEAYIHPDDRQLVLRTIREAMRSKSMFELEHRLRRADGSLGWTYSRAIPLFDEKGEIVEWFGAASDVTARKDAEERYRKLVETLDAEVRARTRDLEQRNNEILSQSEQVRELSWRLLRAQDEERRHIARELHDSAGQTLTVLGMNLVQLVQKAGRNDPELANDAETIQETVQQLHHDIRTTSYLLHPPLLDESGLRSALTWYTEGLVERSGLQIGLDVSKDLGRLPRDMELAVFRLVQECLTNIHRHSASKTASIRIAREEGRVILDIRDTGKGMSPERLIEIQSGSSGVGIRGMQERLRQFKGEMKIESDAAGTRILVAIPVQKNAIAGDEPAEESLQAVS